MRSFSHRLFSRLTPNKTMRREFHCSSLNPNSCKAIKSLTAIKDSGGKAKTHTEHKNPHRGEDFLVTSPCLPFQC